MFERTGIWQKNGLKVWTAALALIIALTGCAREAAERLSPPTSSPALESESGEARSSGKLYAFNRKKEGRAIPDRKDGG